MRYLLVVLSFVLVISGCGVATSSSVSSETSSDVNLTIDENLTVEDNATIEDNVTVTPPNEDQVNSVFDTSGAEQDQNACIVDSVFNFLKDTSFDPLSSADLVNAIEISSKYDYNSDVELTEAVIFYPNLTQSVLSRSVTVYADGYRFGFDESWVANGQRTIYVRTPKIGSLYYGCYRYLLNSIDATLITPTKVYRVN